MIPTAEELAVWEKNAQNDFQSSSMVGSTQYREGYNAALEGKGLPDTTGAAHRFGYVRGIAEVERRRVLRQLA